MKKLHNLLDFKNFDSDWNQNNKKSKRTDVAKDILKENVEEIVPDGLPSESEVETLDLVKNDKIIEITNVIKTVNDDVINKIIDYLRDVLTEMEQQGFIEEDETDELDEKHLDIDEDWILDVINLSNIPEDAIDGVLDIINGHEPPERDIDDETDDDIEL